MAAFGWWFASEKFDETWGLDQLREVLGTVGKIEPVHLVVQRLAAIAPARPLDATEVLSDLIKGEEWRIAGLRGEIRSILSTARKSDSEATRSVATTLVNQLGTRGHFDFADLLP